MNHISDLQTVSEREIKKLYRLHIYGRWLIVFVCCLLILPWSIWQLEESISLCLEHCTWATIRLGMEFHPLATVGISFCLGLITSVLLWQSSSILRGGLSERQKYYLTQKIIKIRQKGGQYWLYNWIYPLKFRK